MADDQPQPLDPQTIAGLLAGTPGEGAATPNPNIQPESTPNNERPNFQAPPTPTGNIQLTQNRGYQGGSLPAIVELAKGLIKPPNQVVDTGNAYRPANRMDVFENFLSDFLQSFSQGMSASGHGPGAFGRGFGAAVQAPFQRSVQLSELQQQRGLSQSEQNLRNQQAAEAASRGEYYRSQANAVTASSALTPVQIPDGQGGYRTEYLPAKNATGILQRTVSGDTARDVAGIKYGEPIQISADLAKQLNLPDALVGKSLSPRTIEELAPKGKVVSTAEGLFMADPRTGQPIGKKLGTPTSIANAQLAAQTKITVESMRDQVQQARIFNAADKPAQIIYSKTMDGINRWANEEQKIGYLDFGADPQQARTAFEAEKRRRIDAANGDLLKRTESKIGVNASPSASPAAGLPVPAKTKTPQARPFASLVSSDPVLQKATTALANVKQKDELKREIEISKALNPSQKSILKGHYGIK